MVLTDTFVSRSNPDKHPYTATYDTVTGHGECSCPWGGPRTRPRDCTHTKQLAARARTGAAPTTTPAPAAAPTSGDGWPFRYTEAEERQMAREREERARPPVPMLASAMTTGQTIDSFTGGAWALEEKYDGHRVIVRKAGDTIEAWSRPRAGESALRRDLPPHVLARVREMPDCLVDGELYRRGGKSSDVTRLDMQDKLVLVLFDALEVLGKPLARNPYHERRSVLSVAVGHSFEGPVQLAKQYVVARGAVEAIWKRGGEGAILKRLESTYQPGRRSPDWIKVKKVGHTVMQIVGFEAGKFGPYTTALCRGTEVAEAKVLTLDNATRATIARDPEAFIGRWLVVEYIEKLASGKLRHATWDHLAAAAEQPAIEVEATQETEPAPDQAPEQPEAHMAADQPPALTPEPPKAADQPPAPVALTAGQKAALTRKRNQAARASGVAPTAPAAPVASEPRAALDLATYVRGRFAQF